MALAAQDVTLTSRDGGVQVSGTLIGYDGEFYRVRSEHGDLTLDGSGVVCTGPGCPDLSAYIADIRLAGPALIADGLMPELLAGFAAQEGYDLRHAAPTVHLTDPQGRVAARFHLDRAANDEAFARMIARQADLVMASRAVLPQEAALAAEAGLGPLTSPGQTRVLALDAAVPVLSRRNPVPALRLDGLAAIFAGQITNWRDLGGVDHPITLILPPEDDPIRAVFVERVMLPLGQSFDAQATTAPDNQTLLAGIARDPFAIGLARLSQAGAVRVPPLEGSCGYLMRATDEALKAEEYPMPAPLFLYRSGDRLPRIGREFLSYLSSPAGQIAVLRAGFADQALTRTGLALQGERLANAIAGAGEGVTLADLQALVGEMRGRARLSLAFRSDARASGLDAQSRANVALLAAALESGTLGADEVSFVGFSAGGDNAAESRRAALADAVAVRDAVLAEALTFEPGTVRIRVLGLGAALPLACGDTPVERAINRRVEVWIR